MQKISPLIFLSFVVMFLVSQEKSLGSEVPEIEEVLSYVEDFYPDYFMGISHDIPGIVGDIESFEQAEELLDMVADSLIQFAPENHKLWLRNLYYHQNVNEVAGLESGPQFSGDLSIGQIELKSRRRIQVSWDPFLRQAPLMSKILKIKMFLIELPYELRYREINNGNGENLGSKRALEVLSFVNTHFVLSSILNQIPKVFLELEFNEFRNFSDPGVTRSLKNWLSEYLFSSSERYDLGIRSLLFLGPLEYSGEIGEITLRILQFFEKLNNSQPYDAVLDDATMRVSRYLRFITNHNNDDVKLAILFKKQHLGKLSKDIVLENVASDMIREIKKTKGCVLSLVK